MNNKLRQSGQTLLELVVGLGIVVIILGAVAITTTYSIRNSQFSKNQVAATKLAETYIEKVRTVKTLNYGVCLQNEATSACSSWESIWTRTFGSRADPADTSCTSGTTPCTFKTIPGCTVPSVTPSNKLLCLVYSAAAEDLPNGFTGRIFIEDESGAANTQKRVTARVYWTDSTGDHSSDLVTVFSKI